MYKNTIKKILPFSHITFAHSAEQWLPLYYTEKSFNLTYWYTEAGSLTFLRPHRKWTLGFLFHGHPKDNP